MGGLGSGNWVSRSTRPTCEALTRLDLRYLQRRGLLQFGKSGSLSWSAEWARTEGARLRSDGDGLILEYAVNKPDGTKENVRERVAISSTSQYFGGRRPWFVCAGCGRRCAVLYCASRFRCRRCLRAVYASQNQSPMWRALTQAQKHRQRLGGSGSTDEPFPSRPKGMHRRSYEAHLERAARLEGRLDDLENALTDRLASLHLEPI